MGMITAPVAIPERTSRHGRDYFCRTIGQIIEDDRELAERKARRENIQATSASPIRRAVNGGTRSIAVSTGASQEREGANV